MAVFDSWFNTKTTSPLKDTSYKSGHYQDSGGSKSWISKPKRTELQSVTAEITLTNHTPVDENIIKEEIAKQLGIELLKRELFEIEQQKDVYNMNDIFKARVKVSPPESQNDYSISYESIFQIQDKEFTVEQVKKALEETFTEYFI